MIVRVTFLEVHHSFSHICLQSAVRYLCHVFLCLLFVYLFGRVLLLVPSASIITKTTDPVTDNATRTLNLIFWNLAGVAQLFLFFSVSLHGYLAIQQKTKNTEKDTLNKVMVR